MLLKGHLRLFLAFPGSMFSTTIRRGSGVLGVVGVGCGVLLGDWGMCNWIVNSAPSSVRGDSDTRSRTRRATVINTPAIMYYEINTMIPIYSPHYPNSISTCGKISMYMLSYVEADNQWSVPGTHVMNNLICHFHPVVIVNVIMVSIGYSHRHKHRHKHIPVL